MNFSDLRGKDLSAGLGDDLGFLVVPTDGTGLPDGLGLDGGGVNRTGLETIGFFGLGVTVVFGA